MRSYGIHIPTKKHCKNGNFFEMTGNFWSDFVNVPDELFDWYMKFDWYGTPCVAFFGILTVWVYTGLYGDIGINFGI